MTDVLNMLLALALCAIVGVFAYDFGKISVENDCRIYGQLTVRGGKPSPLVYSCSPKAAS